MKLLLTGHAGFVAGSIVWQARNDWDVHGISRSKSPEKRDGFQSYQFDLTDTNALRECFEAVQPDAVIHAAAIADIDFCESNQDDAERINFATTDELAGLCASSNTKMVFCSTDTVFDGETGMYMESDTPAPVNFYGETKVRAEQSVLSQLDTAVVARLPLVMGLPVLGAGNSFLAKMITAMSAGQAMQFPENEIRTPADVITLGAALLELAGDESSGIFHLSGSTELNRYEMGKRIAAVLGFAPELVLPGNSNGTPGRAPRPIDVSLDNTKARRELRTPMCTLEQGLDLILKSKAIQDNE
jgi:dTDP-4-dehydrorhamnose reductase